MELAPLAEPAVNEEHLLLRLRELLAGADMAETTERQLRQALEAELGVSLESRKALIRERITQFLNEPALEQPQKGCARALARAARMLTAARALQQEEQDSGLAADGASSRPPSAALTRISLQLLSPQMAHFMGADQARRSEVVAKLWEHIKGKNLQARVRGCGVRRARGRSTRLTRGAQDPNDKRKIRCDEVLEARALPRSLPLPSQPASSSARRRCSSASARTCSNWPRRLGRTWRARRTCWARPVRRGPAPGPPAYPPQRPKRPKKTRPPRCSS